MSSLTQNINNKRKANNNRKEGEKLSGGVHIKKKDKQILCSFITKYSATINIAFLSPFNLLPRMSTFLFPVFNSVNTWYKYKE